MSADSEDGSISARCRSTAAQLIRRRSEPAASGRVTSALQVIFDPVKAGRRKRLAKHWITFWTLLHYEHSSHSCSSSQFYFFPSLIHVTSLHLDKVKVCPLLFRSLLPSIASLMHMVMPHFHVYYTLYCM